MGFKKVGYLSFFVVIVILIIILFFVFEAQKEPLKENKDINCLAFDIFQDKNYLVPYSIFLLNYIGLDPPLDSNILKEITFEIVNGSTIQNMGVSDFDGDAVNAMLVAHKDVPQSQMCIYNIKLLSKVDLITSTKQIYANKPALNMYWLVHITVPEIKMLDSLILENFG